MTDIDNTDNHLITEISPTVSIMFLYHEYNKLVIKYLYSPLDQE